MFRRVERKLADREPGAGQRRFVESAPLLAAMADASARGVVATGPRRGCRIVRAGKIHDARIAALVLYHGARQLLSADRDFSRMAPLVVRNPL